MDEQYLENIIDNQEFEPFGKLKENKKWEKSSSYYECSICGDELKQKARMILNCDHVICKKCNENYHKNNIFEIWRFNNDETNEIECVETEIKKEYQNCPLCRSKILMSEYENKMIALDDINDRYKVILELIENITQDNELDKQTKILRIKENIDEINNFIDSNFYNKMNDVKNMNETILECFYNVNQVSMNIVKQTINIYEE